jgi:membrane-anchored mycosin MYCP
MEGSVDRSDSTSQYLLDQLVVALPHIAAVTGRLHVLGIEAVEKQRDRRLGLALFDLPGLAVAARNIRRKAADPQDRAGGPVGAFTARTAASDLDLILGALREWFATHYGGWTPLIGKNRRIESIHGFPEIVGGDKGYPVPIQDGVQISRPARIGGRRVRVGVLDTALFANPLLRGCYLAAASDMMDPTDGLLPPAGHATFIAGLVLQRASRAELDVHCVLDQDGFATAWDAARRMMDFAGSGTDILNLSWGCQVADGQPPLVLARAVELLSTEMILVAAAGNRSPRGQGIQLLPPGTPIYPAAFHNVVAVSARNTTGELATFSPRGPWIDLAADGVDVASTYLTGKVMLPNGPQNFSGLARWDGTSFAAANVSGEIARHTHPGTISAREVLNRMLNPSGHDQFDAGPPAET